MSRWLSLFLVGIIILAWWGSTLDHATVLWHLNSVAPDGDVESYTMAFHGRVQGNLRLLSGLGILLLVGLLLARWRLGPLLPRIMGGGAMGRFRADLGDMLQRYTKRTSHEHKQFVLLLIMAGAGLRAWMLWAPITYDEAFTWTYYASRPVHVVLADYSYPNNHILHTLLVKFSTTLFGLGKISLRLPAFLAGVLVMPVFYLVVRGMFNRYIAVLALALVAASGGLIEYSALARGYSLTWLFMVIALALGRHFAKENNAVSAMLIGLACALGMWAVPTMIYAAITVYVWLFLTIMFRYRDSKSARLRLLVLSGVVFAAFTMLFYLPVVLVYGVGQLFHHETMPDNTWANFQEDHLVGALDLWEYLYATAGSAAVWAGVAGFLFAGYISARFRVLVVALLLGAGPLVIAQAMVAPARVWLYTLFVLHLSTAIALFYLLKAVQEKLVPKLGKRVRTVWTGVFLLVYMGVMAMRVLPERIARFPEAAVVAGYLADATEPGDRVYTEFPWEAPVEFHCMALGMDRSLLHVPPKPGGLVFVVTEPTAGLGLERVLRRHASTLEDIGAPRVVLDLERSVIFAAPFGEGGDLRNGYLTPQDNGRRRTPGDLQYGEGGEDPALRQEDPQ